MLKLHWKAPIERSISLKETFQTILITFLILLVWLYDFSVYRSKKTIFPLFSFDEQSAQLRKETIIYFTTPTELTINTLIIICLLFTVSIYLRETYLKWRADKYSFTIDNDFVIYKTKDSTYQFKRETIKKISTDNNNVIINVIFPDSDFETSFNIPLFVFKNNKIEFSDFCQKLKVISENTFSVSN